MDGLVFYVVRMKRLKQACHGARRKLGLQLVSVGRVSERRVVICSTDRRTAH